MAHDDGIDDNDIPSELLSYYELCERKDLGKRVDQVGGDHAN